MRPRYDAVVVGSGPNGLAAAITVAQRGGSVLVLEGSPAFGGGARSESLTLPGFVHDVCSAVHPLAVASPFFRQLPLERHGLEWIRSPSPVAHPLDDGSAVPFEEAIADFQAKYPALVRGAREILEEILRPALHLPRHPVLLARFAQAAFQPAASLLQREFGSPRTRALLAGVAAHSMIPLSWQGSSAAMLTLMLAACAGGWPIPRGGAQSLSNALVSYLRSLGGELRCDTTVRALEDLPPARAVFLDVTPWQFARLGSNLLSEPQKRRLARFEHGIGVFKMDFALSAPVPWRATECARAATVHLGGTLEEIAESELAPHEGRLSPRPYVLLAQPSLFDPTRAPAGRHTLWAYCHVPNGSGQDCSEAIENQIERFAPGFRGQVLARSALGPAELEARNPNLIGGNISGGAMNLTRLLFRPRVSVSPYRTPLRNVYLCSSSTPPGPGVHGMCGHWAALEAIGDHLLPR